MDQRCGNHHGWINPLLKRLDLDQKSDDNIDFEKYRTHLEESRLTERIGQIVSTINKAAGYHLLESSDYLPPQKKVLRIAFDKGRILHVMDVTLQDNGVTLVFCSIKKLPGAWEGYLPRYSRGDNAAILLELVIRPAEVTEENIQMWLSYLLSGLNKKFKPSIEAQAADASDVLRNTKFRKASA